MDRADLDAGERALTEAPRIMSRPATRWIAIFSSVAALLVLGQFAARVSESSVAQADLRAADHAAGYLTLIAPARPGRPSADLRLLSATNALANASFWNGQLQVWVEGIPLLPTDSGMGGRATVPLPGLGSVPRGAVAAWDTVPPVVGPSFLGITLIGVLALLLLAASAAMGRNRSARFVALGVLGTVALGSALLLVLQMVRIERAATESGLLRTRRMLEVAAVSRRLTDSAVAELTTGWVVQRVDAGELVRDPVVTWDSLGASVVVTGSRNQAWLVVAPTASSALPVLWPRILLLVLLGAAGAVVAGALPPGGGYLTATSETPLTSS
jgi:hypothetical protein